MFALLREPELYRHLDYPPPPTVEHLSSVYAALEKRQSPDGSQRWLNWVVREPACGLVGYVQATVARSGAAWVAYVLGRKYWGHGFATLATGRMLDHLAEACAVRRYLATVEQANRPSLAVLQRLGFVETAAEEAARDALSPSERLFVRDAASAVSIRCQN